MSLTSCDGDEMPSYPSPSMSPTHTPPTGACAVGYPNAGAPVTPVPLRGGFVRVPAAEAAMASAPEVMLHGGPDEASSSLPADYDGDGRVDLVVNGSRSICGAGIDGSASWLMLQQADGHLGAPVRLGDLNDCRLAADLDGDRDVDLVCFQRRQGWVVRWNDGDVVNGPVTRLVREDGMMAVAAWDLDGDGVLDLLFSGWGLPCHALRGRGDRTYDDVSAAWGLDSRGNTWSTGFVDFDGDGVREVYVTEDGQGLQNRALRDRRAAGSATPRYERYSPMPQSCDVGGWFSTGTDAPMGFAIGDLDRDGLPELVLAVSIRVTALARRATQGGQWGEIFDALELVNAQSTGGAFQVPWSPVLWDMDHDGALDLVVANGDNVPQPMPETRGQSVLQVARGGPRGTLRDVSEAVGVRDPGQFSNVQLGDLDGDGDLDLVVGCFGATPRVYENRVVPASRHVLLSLRGTVSNPEGLGATVRTTTPSQTLPVGDRWAPWATARPEVDVTLGADPNGDRLDITWPSGCRQTARGPFTGPTLTVTEPAWMTLTPASHHVAAGSGATVTVRVSPSLLGRDGDVDITDVAGRARWMGPAQVTDTGDVVRVLRADDAPGELTLSVRVGDVALPAHPRVWFDAPAM